MKKILSFAAAAAVALGMTAAAVPAVETAKAEEEPHIRQATQTVSGLSPYAWYTFDSEENLGKDKTGRFNLEKKANLGGVYEIREDTENGFKYAALRRDKKELNVETFDEERLRETYADKSISSMSGVVFYAPNMDKTGYDMSDLIRESYTVSVTFRAYNPADFGAVQILSTGRYSDATTITPWQQGISVQPTSRWMLGKEASQATIDNWRKGVALNAREWNTVTLVGDAEAGEVKCFVNGVLSEKWEVDPVRFSNQNMEGALGNDYTFSIGGSAARDGGGIEQCSNSDIRECMVFDYALSDKNVAELYAGTETTYEGAAIESVPEIDTSALDFELTDRNTLMGLREKMPKTVSVTLDDGSKERVDIFWTTLGASDTLYGVLQPVKGVNTKGFIYEYKSKFAVKFVYDKTAVVLSDLKLGGKELDPDAVSILTKEEGDVTKSLSFKIEEKAGCRIEAIWYDEEDNFFREDWEGDDEGYVYFRVRYGAEVRIETSGGSGSPTDSSAGGSSGGGNGSDSASGDSAESSGNGKTSGGCGSAVSVGVSAAGVMLAVAAIVGKKKN